MEEIEGVQTAQGGGLSIHKTEARAPAQTECQLCSLKREPSWEAQKDFPGLSLWASLHQHAAGSPNKYQRSEQQEFLPTAHSWNDVLNSKYFPDVETQFAGRSASGVRGTWSSLLPEEGLWPVPY